MYNWLLRWSYMASTIFRQSFSLHTIDNLQILGRSLHPQLSRYFLEIIIQGQNLNSRCHNSRKSFRDSCYRKSHCNLFQKWNSRATIKFIKYINHPPIICSVNWTMLSTNNPLTQHTQNVQEYDQIWLNKKQDAYTANLRTSIII